MAAVIVALALASFTPAPPGETWVSGFQSASDLLRDCRDKTRAEACLGYIRGVFDTANALFISQGRPPLLCLPDKVRVEDVKDPIVRYLEANLADAENLAASVAIIPLAQNYKCPVAPKSDPKP